MLKVLYQEIITLVKSRDITQIVKDKLWNF